MKPKVCRIYIQGVQVHTKMLGQTQIVNIAGMFGTLPKH